MPSRSVPATVVMSTTGVVGNGGLSPRRQALRWTVTAGGPFLIKVSHHELLRDGWAGSEQPAELVGAMHRLRKNGANSVIVSRADEPALALVDDEVLEVRVLTAGVNGLHGLAVSLDVGLRPAGAPHWDTAVHLLPKVLELLTDTPRGTVLTLNVPDRPVGALRELRHAALAEFGTVQTRVDQVDDGQLHLVQIEVDTQPAPGTDCALLAAGHPTLTALESVHETSGPVLSQWLASAVQRIA